MFAMTFTISIFTNVRAVEYHVAKNGNDTNKGTELSPFKSISKAVEYATAGDTITVHQGTYREWINPVRGGESDKKRIVYRAATGEKVEIKGSEVFTRWKKWKGTVWKAMIPNEFFGDYNPFKDLVHGDWLDDNGRIHHIGDVFLNGKSLYEQDTIEKVINPEPSKRSRDKKGSTYVWYCESNETHTTIWANFHEYNPKKELVEISVRPTCFYPQKQGINYLTIQGFYFSQAATQWAAPTAEQVGMIATHWNKGWIIENNVISDSKCNGITLGKERGTGHNTWTADEGNVNRDGNIHYIEVIFKVTRNNWNKANIGSHIVRNNTIFNCEQTAICGSMGAIYSTIENNHIYDIHTKKQFKGWELAGIKFHAPIDVVLKNNRIHNCERGMWLDWMTQGTRVSSNLMYGNKSEDIYMEVNHGPYIIDNNILLSRISIKNWSQGGAYVHNLIGGKVIVKPVHDRFTPYFLPHSVDMLGLAIIHGGDDRFYNNLFLAKRNNMEAYGSAKLPSWIIGNCYINPKEVSLGDSTNTVCVDDKVGFELIEVGKDVYLHYSINEAYLNHKVSVVTSQTLCESKISKARYDNPDGSEITFDTDYFGINRSNKMIVGPFSELKIDNTKIKIWSSEGK